MDLHSARNYDIPTVLKAKACDHIMPASLCIHTYMHTYISLLQDLRKKVMECPVSSRCTQKESHITVVHSNKKRLERLTVCMCVYVCMCMSDGMKHCVVLSYNSSRDNAGQPAKSSSENSSFVSSYGHELGTVGSVVETPYGQPLSPFCFVVPSSSMLAYQMCRHRSDSRDVGVLGL